MTHGIQRLLRMGRNTRDLARAVAFHRDALGFRVAEAAAGSPAWTRLPGVGAAPSRCARLSLGDQHIELLEFRDGEPPAAEVAACDLAFQHCAIVVEDMAKACERVLRHGARPITRGGPQTLPPSTGSVIACKFRDQDGHPFELIAFPAGTGDPAWQAAAGQPTLGIDHSAISIGDAERSIRFHELLGLRVASRGHNHGPEQQWLDDLPGVEVDVIAMQAAERTPHLELLGYLQPRGRAAGPIPPTAVLADRLEWAATGIAVLLEAVTDAGFPEAVVASGRDAGRDLALLRDPDGHLHVLVEASA